jgi:hypothetical protein
MSKTKVVCSAWIITLHLLPPESYRKMNVEVRTADLFGLFVEEVDR